MEKQENFRNIMYMIDLKQNITKIIKLNKYRVVQKKFMM